MKLLLVAAALVLCSLTASAASLLGVEPPDSVLVVRNGFEWAWADPCGQEVGGCGTGITLHHDFSIATEADWVRDFTGLADIAAAFDNGDGGALCASPYFSNSYNHCDMVDVTRVDGVASVWNAPWGAGNDWYSETFVLRPAAAEVPEPGTWALLATGIAALLLRRRSS